MKKIFLYALLLAMASVAAGQKIVFPIRASENKKYITDAENKPVFLKGTASWRMCYKLSLKDVRRFLTNMKATGFNSMIVQISPDDNGGGNVPNLFGEYMFVDKDVSRPNERYFAHIDSVLQICEEMNFVVLLFPLYMGCCHDGWLEVVQHKPNDLQKLRGYGKWVANRYKRFPNLIWASGGDHNETPESLAFAQGIFESDQKHLHMYHTWPGNTSTERLQDANWLTLSATYTYFPGMDDRFNKNYHVYAQLYHEGLRNHKMPYFVFESAYEYERHETTQMLRRQAYWAVLGGSSGHFFGNRDVWRINERWTEALNTPGYASMKIFHEFVSSIPWNTMQPDWGHTFFPSGRGVFNGGTEPGGEDYAVGAFSNDSTIAALYIPSYREVSINLDGFNASSTIKWFDPSTGSYTDVKTNPGNGHLVYLEPPSKLNEKGYEDWLLIIRR